MIRTLCQRLIDNPEIGFNYAYMGSAEYEFGATADARVHLAEAAELSRVSSRIKYGERSVPVVFILSKADEASAIPLMRALADGEYRNKGPMMLSRRPVGWLILAPVPMLCYVNEGDNKERADKFLKHAEQKLEENEVDEEVA